MKNLKTQKYSEKHIKRLLVLYIVFLSVLSVAFVIMPIASAQKDLSQIPLMISGAFLWGGSIGTVVSALKFNKAVKKIDKPKDKKKNQLGLICFFKNKEAKIADIAMFISIICFIVVKICRGNLYLQFVLLAMFVFSFGMHCMLNGKNYFYLNYKVRRHEES